VIIVVVKKIIVSVWTVETMVESPSVNFELLEPIPLMYGYTGVAVSVVFFQSLNQLLLRFGSPKSVHVDEVWKWRNLFVSWVHAVIVGTWDMSWLVRCFSAITMIVAGVNKMRNAENKMRNGICGMHVIGRRR